MTKYEVRLNNISHGIEKIVNEKFDCGLCLKQIISINENLEPVISYQIKNSITGVVDENPDQTKIERLYKNISGIITFIPEQMSKCSCPY